MEISSLERSNIFTCILNILNRMRILTFSRPHNPNLSENLIKCYLYQFKMSHSWMIGVWIDNFYFVSVGESGQLLTDLERNKDQRKAFWTQTTLTLYWWTMGHSTSLEWRSHSELGWKILLLTWKPTLGKVSELWKI